MRVFDTATEMIKQGGTRRGANMGILRVDHPDILAFVSVKSDTSLLTNFNLSVGLTEAFMEAVERDEDYQLVNPRSGEAAGRLNAREVFDRIVEEAWATGEPGIVFIDRMDRDNPTPELGPIEATNPCGEQPLLPYESCNLGSINLAQMVCRDAVDWERLTRTVERAVHFLDNVIDVNRYPLPEIERMTKGNRKIGLGVMGWASMLYRLGIPYGSPESLEFADRVMSCIDDTARKASAALAEARGAFPNFRGSRCDRAEQKPVRNATCTTMAPTGTISILADCSSGIEPLFSLAFVRRVLDGEELLETNPIFEHSAREGGFYSEELMRRVAGGESIQAMRELPEDVRRVFLTAHDITPEEHIRMQAAFQQHTDNAVSKTVNFPESATAEDVAQAYWLAYRLDCKGLTIYRDGAREGQVLSTPTQEHSEKDSTSAHKRHRPRVLTGKTYQMQTGCGPLYITMNEDERGLFEVFTTMGKAGGCAASQCEGIGRLVSLAWRSGVGPEPVIRQLRGISCHKPSGFGPNRVLSCADALSIAIQNHVAPNRQVEKHVSPGGACPECGDAVEHEEGCVLCRSCGFSECG
jgi:ribonucleoside-diphosphate reductase alpha chain